MDAPRGGVQEREVRYHDVLRIRELDEMRAAVVQLTGTEPLPPDGTLPVDNSVVAYSRGVRK